MSVLVRGMEMPGRCWDCDFCYDQFYCRALEIEFREIEGFEPADQRLPDCPLVKVTPWIYADIDTIIDCYSEREEENE